MKYGYFDDGRREYVITRPDTPLPWINYLGAENFFSLLSNTAAGYAFYQDARLRRLIRFRYNQAPLDQGGRFIYLRDRSRGECWSPTGQPMRKELQAYTCRHGLGYSIIQSTYLGIQCRSCFFVPLGANLEIWQLEISNQADTPARLDLFAGVEFCLWDAQDDATNFQRNFSTGEVEVEGSVIYHKTEYRERRNHFAYLACSQPIAGFDTQREAFLGRDRSWENPISVERGACQGSMAHGWAPVGIEQVEVALQPGETRSIIFLLGYQENPLDAKFDPPHSQILNKVHAQEVIAQFTRSEVVETAFRALGAYWDRLLGVFQVTTPDPHANRMVNIWNAYQCMVTFNLSRSASLFESGIGRGMGFRDSNQDLLGFVHMQPERSRLRLLELAATQFETGEAYHQYQPLTRQGNDQVGSGFNDDPLWLILAASAYLKETGDSSILEELVPFDRRPGSEQPLYEHLRRSLAFTLDHLGPHRLPLIGHADWNDCLNLNTFSDSPGESFQTAVHRDGKTAESVFIAALFVLAAQELEQIALWKGDREQVEDCAQAAQGMTAMIHAHGWDGGWFLRAYDYFGEKVGSQECSEGRIFIEPQGMAVMAGLGLEDGRARQALDAVKTCLATPHGIILQQPAYTGYDLRLGEISSYPPGYKENAGIFCHTNPWIMIAEALTGNGDQAYEYYLRINPSAREAISEVHRCEPYVYAQMIAGKDAPAYGEAKNSWLTGAAAWNYVAITQYLLGVRPEMGGLRLDPCIPSGWDGFEVTRTFRGARYRITVHNPEHVCHGIKRLTVEGLEIPEGLIPPGGAGQEVRVEAWLGKVAEAK